MDDVPGKFLQQVSDAMEHTAEKVVKRHESEGHPERKRKMRPFDRRPLEVIPYDDVPVSDEDLERAVELSEEQGLNPYEIAAVLGKPVWALERAMADFKYRWKAHLFDRTIKDS